MPLPPRLHAQPVTPAHDPAADVRAAACRTAPGRGACSGRHAVLPLLILAAVCAGHADDTHASPAQTAPSAAAASIPAAGLTSADSELERASEGRVVRVAALTPGGPVTVLPLEIYVAQVLAGEGEPRASEAATDALATVIRTYLVANQGRHRREGFDFCATTHCQVARRATAATRLATAATAGLVLQYHGTAAEVFYSASCGGRSEAAADIWPNARFPYLLSRDDEVHDEDRPWTYERTLPEMQAALLHDGIGGGRLTDIRVETRSASGRAAQIRLVGLEPELIAGDRFRRAIGAAEVRSTAFVIERDGNRLRLVGRGYGHGVGLCVVGAGRRAARGEQAQAILAHYFPGLTVARLGPAR
jgi:stage II sporulation protein D